MRTSPGSLIRWIREKSNYQGDECLIWPFGVSTTGYAKLGNSYAHIAMCELVHGPSPSEEHEVAHSCGKRLCLAPKHIRWRTHKENEAEKIIHGTLLKGEEAGRAKLSEKDVFEILERLDSGETHKSLALRFDVHISNIAHIKSGRNWGWLTEMRRR